MTAPHARQEFAGNTIALLSPHGGAGRTTAAVNLALALAERAPTVLWDCVGWYGTCYVALDLDPGVAIDGLRAMPSEELEMLLMPVYMLGYRRGRRSHPWVVPSRQQLGHLPRVS